MHSSCFSLIVRGWSPLSVCYSLSADGVCSCSFPHTGKAPLLSQKVLVLGRKRTRDKNKGVKVSYSCFWNEPTSVLSVWVGFLSITEKIWGRGQGWMLSTCDWLFASNTCSKVAQKKLCGPRPGMVPHTFNPNSYEAEQGDLRVWGQTGRQWVWGQPGIHREIISWKQTQTKQVLQFKVTKWSRWWLQSLIHCSEAAVPGTLGLHRETLSTKTKNEGKKRGGRERRREKGRTQGRKEGRILKDHVKSTIGAHL